MNFKTCFSTPPASEANPMDAWHRNKSFDNYLKNDWGHSRSSVHTNLLDLNTTMQRPELSAMDSEPSTRTPTDPIRNQFNILLWHVILNEYDELLNNKQYTEYIDVDSIKYVSYPKIFSSYSRIYSELEETYMECSVDNWDGYGAKAVSEENYLQSIKFLEEIAKTLALPDEVSVDPDGEIAFEWYVEPYKNFTVSISKNKKLTYAGLFNRDSAHGTVSWDTGIPNDIIFYLDKLYPADKQPLFKWIFSNHTTP